MAHKTEAEARQAAKRLARKRKATVYVVYEDEDDGRGPYQLASDFDLETFFLGAPVVAAVEGGAHA